MREMDLITGLLGDLDRFFLEEVANRFAVEGADKTEPGDRVTAIDLACQKIILDRIARDYPEDVIYAEEAGCSDPPTDPCCRCWIIDPLDGTYNFQRTLSPSYAVSIALTQHGETIASGILVPELSLRFTAEKGQGAYCNGTRLNVSSIDILTEAKVDVDFSERSRRRECLEVARDLMENASQVRSTGSTVVALCSIAMGLTEIFIHPYPQPWDYAAGKLVVEEAGGQLSRFNGDAVDLLDGRTDLIASNARVLVGAEIRRGRIALTTKGEIVKFD